MPFLALAMSQIDASHLSRPMGESSDRKSTRLNSSHGYISYAVFCLKKKKTNTCPATPAKSSYSQYSLVASYFTCRSSLYDFSFRLLSIAAQVCYVSRLIITDVVATL